MEEYGNEIRKERKEKMNGNQWKGKEMEGNGMEYLNGNYEKKNIQKNQNGMDS